MEMNHSETKKKLRAHYQTVRAEISETSRSRSQAAVHSHLTTLVTELSQVRDVPISMIGSYQPIRAEVELSALAQWLPGGARFCYPKIKGNVLDFFAATKFAKGRFGVLEPLLEPSQVPVSPEAIDLILVPGLAFDRSGHRLGYGAGFYDRYLLQTEATKVGVCFAEQMTETSLGLDPHDHPMDFVVTENFILSPSTENRWSERVS